MADLAVVKDVSRVAAVLKQKAGVGAHPLLGCEGRVAMASTPVGVEEPAGAADLQAAAKALARRSGCLTYAAGCRPEVGTTAPARDRPSILVASALAAKQAASSGAPSSAAEAANGDAERVSLDEAMKKKWNSMVQAATVNADVYRCVKWVPSEDGKYVAPDGRRMNVENIPLWGSTENLHEYGCSATVGLYLRFMVESIILFLIMAVVASQAVASYAARGAARNECRTGFTDHWRHHGALNWTHHDPLAIACAYYPAKPIYHLIPAVPWYLTLSVGHCQEYQEGMTSLLPIAVQGASSPFIDTDGAIFCAQPVPAGSGPFAKGDSIALHYLANTIIFLLFLLRWRRIENVYAQSADMSALTTADYAVFVKGLVEGVAIEGAGHDSAEALLRQDLRDLGFNDRQVNHIELARACASELKVCRRFASNICAVAVLMPQLSHRSAPVAPSPTSCCHTQDHSCPSQDHSCPWLLCLAGRLDDGGHQDPAAGAGDHARHPALSGLSARHQDLQAKACRAAGEATEESQQAGSDVRQPGPPDDGTRVYRLQLRSR